MSGATPRQSRAQLCTFAKVAEVMAKVPPSETMWGPGDDSGGPTATHVVDPR